MLKTKIVERSRIPTHIVLELLGTVSFCKKDGEKDVQIAEQIASQDYETMTSLIEKIEAFIDHKDLKRNWARAKQTLHLNPYFAPHFYPIDSDIRYVEWRTSKKRRQPMMIIAKVKKPPYMEDGEYWMDIKIGEYYHHICWDKKKLRWESGDL